jgi:crotonobetainyl-CoA:carnitine CoA-transferase CaiB-like acyl-CoA transferase
MKSPAGRAAMLKMTQQADIIVEAFRPGVMDRFGLGYAAVASINPRVIYLSVNGFGSTGPLVDAPATDVILQGFAGVMNMNRDTEGTPQRIDHVLIDVITGLYGFQGILSALLTRNGPNKFGQHIECSMLQSAMAFQAGKILEDALQPERRLWFVPQGGFQTSDGQITISVRRDDHFARLCEAIGRTDLSDKFASSALRTAHASELLTDLRHEFSRRSTAELSELLRQHDILHAPINTYASLLAHEQTQSVKAFHWHHQNGFDKPLPFANTPGNSDDSLLSSAPHLGEHTREAMVDWGLLDWEIDELAACGAIPPSPKPSDALPQ